MPHAPKAKKNAERPQRCESGAVALKNTLASNTSSTWRPFCAILTEPWVHRLNRASRSVLFSKNITHALLNRLEHTKIRKTKQKITVTQNEQKQKVLLLTHPGYVLLYLDASGPNTFGSRAEYSPIDAISCRVLPSANNALTCIFSCSIICASRVICQKRANGGEARTQPYSTGNRKKQEQNTFGVRQIVSDKSQNRVRPGTGNSKQGSNLGPHVTRGGIPAGQ